MPILESQTKYWKDSQLTTIEAIAGERRVIALLDPICLDRFQNGTMLKNISFKYAADDFYYCEHISYKVYQGNVAVFFNGPPTACPIYPWCREL